MNFFANYYNLYHINRRVLIFSIKIFLNLIVIFSEHVDKNIDSDEIFSIINSASRNKIIECTFEIA
jgi:uncharacterized LabA/DUF88 family protein